MKIVVLGAGALGSIVAGHLAQAGEDVTLVARGDRAAYLMENGITITGLAEFNVACTVETDPSKISEADVLIVAVKTHQMDKAISGLSHIRFSTVASVQNGVRANDQLAEVFGAANTLGGVASFSGEVLPDGDVRFTVNAGFQIGELPEGPSDRVEDLCAMLRNSGVNAEGVAHFHTYQGWKLALGGGVPRVSRGGSGYTQRAPCRRRGARDLCPVSATLPAVRRLGSRPRRRPSQWRRGDTFRARYPLECQTTWQIPRPNRW